MKNIKTLLSLFSFFIFTNSLIAQDQITVDTIMVSDDTYVQRNINNPGENGDKPSIKASNGSDSWSGYKNNWSGISFFKFNISSIDTTAIDSIVFSITAHHTASFNEMRDPPVVTNYVAHVPVEEGVSDNWDEETMFWELAVSYWSYGEIKDGDSGLWFREALNDTTKIGSFDIKSETDTIEPKRLEITETVKSHESDYLTLSIYDRDRNPDVAGFNPEEVLEGVSIYYRSKEDPAANENQMPMLLIYHTPTTSVSSFKTEDFKVYPNPANNYIRINAKLAKQTKATIIDITGKEINSKSITNTQNVFDISDLNPGFYILLLENESMKSTIRFTKQ